MKNLVGLCLFMCSFLLNAQEPLSLDAEIDLGYGYDSNVSVDDVDLSTNIGDQFADIRVSAEASYNSRNNLQFSANLTLSEKLYNRFSQFDGLLTLASLSADKEVGNFNLGLTARYVDYQLDNDGFLRLTQLSPALGWFYRKKTYLHLAFERSDESYQQDSARDSNRNEIRLSLYYFLNGLRKYIAIQAEIAQKKADASIFDNDAWQIQFSYFSRLNLFSRDSTLKLGYLYQERDYDSSVNPIIGDFRKDQRHRYELELTMPIKDAWSVISKISYNDYGSNFASSDYTQHVYQVAVRYEF